MKMAHGFWWASWSPPSEGKTSWNASWQGGRKREGELEEWGNGVDGDSGEVSESVREASNFDCPVGTEARSVYRAILSG